VSFTIAEDLQSLLDTNYDYTNTSASAKPNIRLKESNKPTTHSTNGEIIVEDEQLVRIDKKGQYRDETYVVKVRLTYNSANSTIIKQMLAEIDRVLETESKAHTSYYYKFSYVWKARYKKGVINLLVEVLNADVARS